jgi:hypothetical protein
MKWKTIFEFCVLALFLTACRNVPLGTEGTTLPLDADASSSSLQTFSAYVNDVQTKQATVAWLTLQNASLFHLALDLKKQDSDVLVSSHQIDGDAQDYILDNLEPSTNYRIDGALYHEAQGMLKDFTLYFRTQQEQDDSNGSGGQGNNDPDLIELAAPQNLIVENYGALGGHLLESDNGGGTVIIDDPYPDYITHLAAWDAYVGSDHEGFLIRYQKGNSDFYHYLPTVAPHIFERTNTFTNCVPGTSVRYEVKALGQEGVSEDSPWSNVASILCPGIIN